jgi:hypothetical protein
MDLFIYRRPADDAHRRLDSTGRMGRDLLRRPRSRPGSRRSVSLGSDHELLDLPAEMNTLSFPAWI